MGSGSFFFQSFISGESFAPALDVPGPVWSALSSFAVGPASLSLLRRGRPAYQQWPSFGQLCGCLCHFCFYASGSDWFIRPHPLPVPSTKNDRPSPSILTLPLLLLSFL